MTLFCTTHDIYLLLNFNMMDAFCLMMNFQKYSDIILYYISYHYLLNKYIFIYCNNRYNSPLLNWWLTDEKRENENFWIPPLFWGNEAVAGRRCHLSHVRLVRAPVESPDKILCWELLLPRYKGWTCDYPDNREDVRIISWYSNSANFPAAEVAYLL